MKKKLIEKRAELYDSMKAFLDERRGENGLLTAEDEVTYDKMSNELDAYGREIDRLNDLENKEKVLNAPTTAPVVSIPAGTEPKDAYAEKFVNSVLRGNQPIIKDEMKIGTDANGGYLVPTEMEKQIVVDLAENNVIRRLARVIQTASDREIPVAATHSVANWTLESAKATESNPTFKQIVLKAYKLTDLIKISDELLQDSAVNITAYIAAEIARAFGAKEEEAFCVGTGTNQPTGIFTTDGGTVGVTAAKQDAITADEVLDLIYSLKAPYRAKASFIVNDATIKAVRKLKDLQGQYLWQPSLQAGQPDRLAGYAVYTSPYAPTMAASALAIAFGDFNYYTIADRKGRTIKRLSELYAEEGLVGFIANQRLDAKVTLNEAIKLLKMAD